MPAASSPEDGTRFVPDSLYNVFAYLSTGLLFLSVFLILFVEPAALLRHWKSLELAGQLAVVPFILSGVYIYSEFISVASYHVIRKPVSAFVRSLKPKASRDFFFDYQELIKEFDLLDELSDKQRGNYWSLIYWITVNHPTIGNDLFERHARVKMARMNALNFFIIFCLSCLCLLFKPGFMANSTIKNVSVEYLALIGSLVATLLFSFEFYQRQCWFGDIVIKIFASITKRDKETRASGTVV